MKLVDELRAMAEKVREVLGGHHAEVLEEMAQAAEHAAPQTEILTEPDKIPVVEVPGLDFTEPSSLEEQESQLTSKIQPSTDSSTSNQSVGDKKEK